MELIRVKIRSNSATYDKFFVCWEGLSPLGPWQRKRRDFGPFLTVFVDGMLAYCIVKELKTSDAFRLIFVNLIQKYNEVGTVVYKLIEPKQQIIDYGWNRRMSLMIRERCELDYTLSYLSTFGGAFSALGDYFVRHAQIAGRISLQQLRLAVRLQDPSVVSRCMLYLSLSLIQQGRLGKARGIIEREYRKAKAGVVVDTRLVRMCLGIWARLRCEYVMRRGGVAWH